MKRVKVKWVVLWSLWLAGLVRQPTLEVHVSGGRLRGDIARDGSHAQYFAIPYATARRFQAPGPEPTWEGVFEAVDENIRCPQYYGSLMVGRENCLALNVYTPLGVSEKPWPVMVFIHGGGFFEGSGGTYLYGPNYIASKGVILVTINYRLNIQGFLCLRIKEAPGNAGLKDQVAALKWVQNNIRAFGGDPDNVTIFGESAGSASVSYHVLSKMSQNLFHKAILQSGSSLAAWALQYRPVYKASLLAKTMGFESLVPIELYNYFINKTDSELILTRVPRKEGNTVVSELLYVPCIEEVIDGVEPFLTDLPYDKLSRGDFNKVPMILGVNSEEGYFFATLENDTVLPKISFEKSLPKDLVFTSEKEKKIAAENLERLYMGGQDVSKTTLLEFSKFVGDMYFDYPIILETNFMLNNNDKPIYSYVFNYSSWRNLAKMTSGEPFRSAPGATHADELFYLFKQNIIPTFFKMEMIDRVTTLWTNFAKYGDPTPHTTGMFPLKWPQTEPSSRRSLVIDSEFTSTPLWRSEKLKYWHELYAKYRRKL